MVWNLRRWLLAALIGLAVCSAASQWLLLPWLQRHPDVIAAWLSQRSGLPIAFDQLDAEWNRHGPLLRLHQLRLGADEGLAIPQIQLQLLPYSGWRPGSPLSIVRVDGLTLDMHADDHGQWHLRGLPSAATDDSNSDPFALLRRLGEVQLVNAQIRLHVPASSWQLELPKAHLRLQANQHGLRAGARLWVDSQTPPLTAVISTNKELTDGRFFIHLEPENWASWMAQLPAADIQLLHAHGPLQLWLDMTQQRLVSATAVADLSALKWQGLPFAATDSSPEVCFKHLQLRARWQRRGENWALHAPYLRIALADEQTQILDGLHMAGGQHYALYGKEIDVTPLLRLATLSGRVDHGLRQWLYRAQPKLRFADVAMTWQPGHYTRIQGDLAQMAFASVGGSPGLSGLQGHLEGDQYGAALHLQTTEPVRFDWPSGFGEVHEVQLHGPIVLWKHDNGTHISTPGLRVVGTDYAADLRGGLYFQGDGTRPWIAMAAALDHAPMTAAKRFWVRSQMSQAAIDWLDAALVGGEVRNGFGLAVGDLDDWPFENNNGRFEARGQIVNGLIHFSEGWPLLHEVQADIGFVGNGFAIHGNGQLLDAPVAEFSADIADFSAPWLNVTAQTNSDSGDLLAVLRHSPLQVSYQDTFDALRLSGPAAVNFDLRQALDDDLEDEGHLRGSVELHAVSVNDTRVNLPLDQVRGRVDYSDNGFSAPSLRVHHAGGAGSLSLRSGEFVRQANHLFEAALHLDASAQDMLQRAELPWLQGWIKGVSRWHVAFNQPEMRADGVLPAPWLHLYSDLQGTALHFPAPLNKPVTDTLPITINLRLPMEDAPDQIPIDIRLDNRLAMAIRSSPEATGVRIHVGSARGALSPLSEGLMIEGQTPTLDVSGWLAALAKWNTPEQSGGLTLRDVDIHADQLLLAGAQFAATRLHIQPREQALHVQVEGPALAGTVDIPDDGPIRGQFRRVAWKTPPPASAASTADLAFGDTFNPAQLPAFILDIDALNVDEMSLGSAVIHTQPLADGIHINPLQLRIPGGQTIDIRGQWRGQASRARTELEAQISSENVGKLLERFGYPGQLRGGRGQIRMQLAWPGAPDAFTLPLLQGNLRFNIENGQLLEIQPGAGRMLGLLSTGQIPRRLRLDFRDFYARGLAFNQLEGQVQFAEGIARSPAINIHGPAVDIRLYGQADLQQRQFNQTVEMHPRSGNLLTAVGAVAGGPIGAVVGAATNALFSRPLGHIGAKTWHITGPWHDPVVEEIPRPPSVGLVPAVK